MATRSYTRTGGSVSACHPDQLASNIDVALSRTGTVCTVEGLTIFVTHPSLVAVDDATIDSTISAYVLDPLYGQSLERHNLAGDVATLNSWANDADTTVAGWDASTQSQKNAATKVVINRFGILCRRMGDFLTVMGIT